MGPLKLCDRFLLHGLVGSIEMKACRHCRLVPHVRAQRLLNDSLKTALPDVYALNDQQNAALHPGDNSNEQMQTCNDDLSSNTSSTCRIRRKQQSQQRCRKNEGETTAEGRTLEWQRCNEKFVELERQKPAEVADDPRDVEAIRDPEMQMGEYKLKSDVNS